MNEYATSIKKWIDYRVENNETNIVSFCISLANVKTNMYKDELILKIKDIFKKIGVNSYVVDTVEGSFNLDRDWLETEPFEAIVEYCGVYPIKMNPEDSAWLSELDDEGKIRIVVFVKRDDKFVPNT